MEDEDLEITALTKQIKALCEKKVWEEEEKQKWEEADGVRWEELERVRAVEEKKRAAEIGEQEEVESECRDRGRDGVV